MLIAPENDPMGLAISDFYNKRKTAKLYTCTHLTTYDELPIAYLFRTYDEMPEIERVAIDSARGRVLDVGAAAGAHSVCLQQKGIDVTAIDNSLLSVEVMQARGVKAEAADFFDYKPEQPFDTLLFLMNGAGMCGTISRLPLFLNKCKSLLASGGQILLDSSDLIYLYMEDDGSCAIDLNGDYYGEMLFKVRYKQLRSQPFKWLFVDFDTLKQNAFCCGLSCEKMVEGPHYDYLARLTAI